MKKPTLNLIFRKPHPAFNSIENVFNALVPYLEKELKVRKVTLPYRTSGVISMLQNRRFISKIPGAEIGHVTGHENYLVPKLHRATILTMHDIGSAFTGNPVRDRFIRKYWFDIPFQVAERITVISDFSAGELKERYPDIEEKLVVIPNPVDDRILFSVKPFPKEKPVILCIGTKPNKNLERTIEAASGISCILVILGKIIPEQKRMLAQHKIEYRNESGVPFERVRRLYVESDILCYPSLYEGFGMPILEAQATGRPVLTSGRGAMKETAGNGALLVDPMDTAQIRKGLLRLIEDAGLRERLVAVGQVNAAKHSARDIAARYLELYGKMLNEA